MIGGENFIGQARTMTEDGSVDFVSATPDPDSGCHAGLSLLTAIESAARRQADKIKTGVQWPQ